ncbi:MAG: hypothetical protein M1828_004151 [Chrysothrix sp. TS-e1954]|nr:MAG: hypothetical protein M1828_004151 [Chrysothrix sp. TS-e1954]
MDSFTPQQTIELVSRLGCKKAHMRIDKLFVNSFMAGPLLGFGCAVLVSTNAAPWYQENAPGLIRMIGSLIFPVGLTMIVLSGADLWTTNIMYMITSLLSRRINILPLLTSWTISYLGNLAGTLFFMAIIIGYGGVFEETPIYKQAAIRIAMQKCSQPTFHQIFLRAIGANWLVCLAVYGSIQAREVVSKIAAIWWPTATFVALALDHTIANMFFIPLGIFLGADITVGTYVWKSMVASTLGNIVGGGLFVGAMYWYLYLSGEAGVAVGFNIGAEETAIEGGAGPLRISGRDPDAMNGAATPGAGSSGGQLMSGIGRDLSDDSMYAKTCVERDRARSQQKDEKV